MKLLRNHKTLETLSSESLFFPFAFVSSCSAKHSHVFPLAAAPSQSRSGVPAGAGCRCPSPGERRAPARAPAEPSRGCPRGEHRRLVLKSSRVFGEPGNEATLILAWRARSRCLARDFPATGEPCPAAARTGAGGHACKRPA